MPLAQILIIESDPILSLDTQLNLENLGYRVPAVCRTGEDALEFLRTASPDLVILSVNLPGKLNGLQTAEIIRRDHSLPIIFATSSKAALSSMPGWVFLQSSARSRCMGFTCKTPRG